jgi:sporulation protein YlmC with PRC-barrel domain
MTAAGDRLGLAHHVLDHQLVDARGERCGKVDDLALMAGERGEMEVRAVLAGPGVLTRRVNSRALRWVTGLAGDRQVQVPWDQVADVQDHVTLAFSAPEVGLAQGEERAAELLGRVLGPDAHPVRLGPVGVPDAPVHDEPGMLRLSSVLGRSAVDESGAHLGRVHELVAEKSGRLLNEAAGNAWVIVGASVGRSAVRARLGLGNDDAVVRPVRQWPAGPTDPLVLGPPLGR